MGLSDDIDMISAALPGEPVAASHIEVVSDRPGRGPAAPSAFDVDRLLMATAGYALAAADAADGSSARVPARRRRIDPRHVAAYCTTHVEVDGIRPPAWADLSGLYATADGRSIQLHCNFPHHAAGVVERLGCRHDRDAVAAVISERNGARLEEELIAAGMIAALVRTLDEWDGHPHAAATRDLPVVSVERLGWAVPRRAPEAVSSVPGTDLPLHGVRVVDCSRVLAGPEAGRMLAGFGADVVRVGAEHLPSVPLCVMATGFGKRNASIDLTTPVGRAELEELLRGADVWIDGFRPGALAALGFSPERIADLSPGIVVVRISAFDDVGPWAGRRGFDSIVQSTTGVRCAGGEFAAGADAPIGLPVQALDYGTGFLAAGVAAQLLAHQRREGGSWGAQLSLLRTRNHLVGLGGPAAFTPREVAVDPDLLHTVESDFGVLTTVRPFAGEVRSAPQRLGTSPPAWVE